MESAQMLVLVRDGHALEILMISDSLEVPTDKQTVNFVAVTLFQLFDVFVNRVQLAMAAPLNSNLGGSPQRI